MTSRLEWKILEYGTVASTQDTARELAHSGEPEGTVVLAVHQTRGRGREGRKWHSPAGCGIWATCILRPRTAPECMPILSMMVSVSIAIAIENLTGRVVSLKWPNDIYVGGKKLGGVLCEAETHSALGTLFVLAGFGINLRRPEGGFDPEIADLATSLEALAETCPARDTVLSSVLHAMDEMYRRFEEDGGRHVIQEVRRRDMLRGQIVKLRVGAGVVEGMAVGLGEQGGLLLARGTEEPREFTTGVVIEASRAARTSEDGTSRRGSH